MDIPEPEQIPWTGVVKVYGEHTYLASGRDDFLVPLLRTDTRNAPLRFSLHPKEDLGPPGRGEKPPDHWDSI